LLQVYYIVDEDSDGVPDFNGTLLRGDTPNGVVVQGSDLLLSGFEDGKGMVWRLPNVHSYALRNQVRWCDDVMDIMLQMRQCQAWGKRGCTLVWKRALCHLACIWWWFNLRVCSSTSGTPRVLILHCASADSSVFLTASCCSPVTPTSVLLVLLAVTAARQGLSLNAQPVHKWLR
jgi:hypothetical protein